MKVSIITPTLNSERFIKDCIESVKNQSYLDIEHIIVDGGSVDSTLKLIKEYENSYDLKLISGKDNGIYDALNKGIKSSTGEIIGILHSDDFYVHSQVIEKIVKVFLEGNVDSCFADLCYVSKENPNRVIRYWKAGNFDITNFKNGWMPPHPTLFVKKEVFDKYGLYSLDYKISSDYEFIVRVLYKFKIRTYYINELIVKMRVGGASNKSLKNVIQKVKEDYRIIQKYKLDGCKTLILKNFSKINQFFAKEK